MMKHGISKPWGSCEVMERRRGHQVKKLFINGGERIRTESHRDREERWVVLRGRIRAHIEGNSREMVDGQICHVKKNQKHCIIGIAPISVVLEITLGKPCLEGYTVQRERCITDRSVLKPWGAYEVIEKKKKYWIKKLFVDGGEQLSLQSHRERDEGWIVLQGHICAQIEDENREMTAGQMCYIEKLQKHRIIGIAPISVVLEVALGRPLEGDITRYEDQYGRAKELRREDTTTQYRREGVIIQ